MADILTTVSGALIIRFLLVWQSIAMAGVYFLAVWDGHVKPWPHIPMISDCGCYPPESNVFQIGFIVSATIMACASIMFKGAVEILLSQKSPSTGQHLVSKAARLANATLNNNIVWLSIIASAGLAGVSTVNECEYLPLHVIFAVTFFGGYLIYMHAVVLLLVNARKSGALVSSGTIFWKTFFLGCNVASLIGMGISAIFNFKNGVSGGEWLAVFSVLAFNGTFLHELKNYVAMAVVNDSN
eukprot:TRINITY_DN1_c12_g1_i1.p1 TRINITY_DN1_c12_g1~~TRINITY_DN1_c12_g1_i1.p1  ORF type:complete len:241 (-),score=52.84 TRINITY_DN1_c12_g1_i1:169-891(-)